MRLRLTDTELEDPLGAEFDAVFARAQAEADEFYATVIPATLSDDETTRDAAGVGRNAVVEAVLSL